MSDPFRYELRNPEIEAMLTEIGSILIKACKLHGDYGFMLMIFGFGESEDLFYTSNANREDMIATMQEFIRKFREN